MSSWKNRHDIKYYRPRGLWLQLDRDEGGEWFVSMDVIKTSLYNATNNRSMPDEHVPLALTTQQKTVVLNVAKQRLVELTQPGAPGEGLTLLPQEMEENNL